MNEIKEIKKQCDKETDELVKILEDLKVNNKELFLETKGYLKGISQIKN